MRDDRTVRTTLDIDDDVLQAAKEIGGLQGRTTGQVLSELARKALAPAPHARARVRNGVPLLPSRADAPIMTMTDVNRLRDEV
jgi:hypothetical protein